MVEVVVKWWWLSAEEVVVVVIYKIGEAMKVKCDEVVMTTPTAWRGPQKWWWRWSGGSRRGCVIVLVVWTPKIGFVIISTTLGKFRWLDGLHMLWWSVESIMYSVKLLEIKDYLQTRNVSAEWNLECIEGCGSMFQSSGSNDLWIVLLLTYF